MTSTFRDVLAALLRDRGYEHDDAADPYDLQWRHRTLGVRPMLTCVAHEVDKAHPDGTKFTGWQTYDVSVGVPVAERIDAYVAEAAEALHPEHKGATPPSYHDCACARAMR